MTCLNFLFQRQRVLIAMDTLATKGAFGEHTAHVLKFHFIPRFQLLVCGTGVWDFITQWVEALNDAEDESYEELRKGIPRVASDVWNGSGAWMAAPSATATLYHFVYDEKSKTFRASAHRSEKGFEEEEFREGFALKPRLVKDLQDGFLDRIDALPPSRPSDEWFRLMTDIAVAQSNPDNLPKDAIVYVGGQLLGVELTPEVSTIRKLHDFNKAEGKRHGTP